MHELVATGQQYGVHKLCPSLPRLGPLIRHGSKGANEPLGEGRTSFGVMNGDRVLIEILLEESAVPFACFPVCVNYLGLSPILTNDSIIPTARSFSVLPLIATTDAYFEKVSIHAIAVSFCWFSR